MGRRARFIWLILLLWLLAGPAFAAGRESVPGINPYVTDVGPGSPEKDGEGEARLQLPDHVDLVILIWRSLPVCAGVFLISGMCILVECLQEREAGGMDRRKKIRKPGQ